MKYTIASKGIGIGKAFVFNTEDFDVQQHTVSSIDEELTKLKKAIESSIDDIIAIKERLPSNEDKAIFDAHLEMIKDPEIKDQVHAMIRDENHNASYAYKQVTDQFIQTFQAMENAYFKERASDVYDIQKRVLSKLLNKETKLDDMPDETILIAHDLTPSDTALLDFDKVKGIITEVGGKTSHSAILARSFNIPSMVGVANVLDRINQGDTVILDAIEGDVLINPDESNLKTARQKEKKYHQQLVDLNTFANQKTMTHDNKHYQLYGNIGNINEIEPLKNVGAEGIGLFRTEFLFMGLDSMPDEHTQIKAYKKVFEAFPEVVIRTLDIGGDKSLKYLKQEKEDNPFLGVRAIRLCFNELTLFKTQLSAILQASQSGKDVRIMFPMIARVEELLQAKSILNSVMEGLEKNNTPYQKNIKIGIMIEIPSAALNAETLGKHVDFFSIGTNDLIQYLYAADRMNDAVDYLNEPYDPTLYRLIHHVVKAANKTQTDMSVCGEIAGELDTALILLGLGINKLSMNASSILRIRKAISKLTNEEIDCLASDILTFEHSAEVKVLLEKYTHKLNAQ